MPIISLCNFSDSQDEIPERVKRQYTGSTIVYSQEQSMKELSGSSSSDESITCSDRAVLEDFDDEELGCKHHEEVTCVTEESKKINFRLEDVCVEGNTLLWDIVQDKNAVSFTYVYSFYQSYQEHPTRGFTSVKWPSGYLLFCDNIEGQV